MSTLNRSHVVSRFINFVVNQANSNITWGTNAVPFGEFPATYYFGGTTTGIPFTSGEEMINAGTVTALDVYNKLLQKTQEYTRIRMVRIQRNVTGNGTNRAGAGAGINWDATAVANMTTGAGSVASNVSDPINRYGVNNTSAVASGTLDNLMNGLWNAYVASARAYTTQVIRIDVCHAQCHQDCHSSRGRR